MAKITSFDKATCRLVADRIQKALASLSDELGVQIAYRGGSFSPAQYTMKLEIATVDSDGTVKTREAENFRIMAKLYGLEPTDLGRTFRQSGRTFKITGLAARRSKRPIVAADVASGKTFVFTLEDVKRALASEASL